MESQLPPFEALAPRQAEFLAQRRERVCALFPLYEKLRGMLLGIGGLEVVLPLYDEYSASERRRQHHETEQIIVRGQTWHGSHLVESPMEASKCHFNVATLGAKGKGAVATGYGLSEDGLWRQHSWLIEAPNSEPNTIVETTVGRLLYHGYVLTPHEQGRFIRSELG